MKKAVLTLALLSVVSTAVSAVDLGVVSTADRLRFEVYALDSAGIPATPDSGHVLVWFQGEATANSASYSNRWTNAGAGGAEIDSVRYASHTYYYFADSVADIDNNEGNGVYTGVVVLYTKLLPTPNRFTFTVAGDELSDYWAEVKRIGDSIDAYDGWIARQATLTGTLTANIAQISGDAAAADNLETMLDGTGGQTLTLGRLYVSGANGSTGSFRVENSTGPAVYWRATGSNGHGLYAWGHGTGNGMFGRGGGTSPAAGISGHDDLGFGMYLSSNGAQPAFQVLNTGDGHAVLFTDQGSNGDGFRIDSDSGNGLNIISGRSSTGTPNPHALRIFGDTTAASAIRITTRGHGNGVWIDADSAAAVLFDGNYANSGLQITNGADGITIEDTTATGEQIAVMPDHWTAADSTGFQGSAAGLDSTDIARAVWNAPAANHVASGTYGAYLDTAVSSFTVGSGAFSTTLFAYDTSNSQTVAGVRLAVWNSSLTSLKAVVMTGSSGSVGINADSGTYVVAATAPGYTFAAYDTIVVSGPQIDTVRGYQFDPGTPSSPGLCRVFGYLFTSEGVAESGARISAWLPSGVTRLENLIISPTPVSATTDEYGYFYLDLIPSSLLNGEPKYEITINRTDGTILRKRVIIPATAQWQLAW